MAIIAKEVKAFSQELKKQSEQERPGNPGNLFLGALVFMKPFMCKQK